MRIEPTSTPFTCKIRPKPVGRWGMGLLDGMDLVTMHIFYPSKSYTPCVYVNLKCTAVIMSYEMPLVNKLLYLSLSYVSIARLIAPQDYSTVPLFMIMIKGDNDTFIR